MIYNEHTPDIRLQAFVECYWSGSGLATSLVSHKVIPDGCVDILFSFSGDNSSDLFKQGQPFLNGTMTYSFDVFQPYNISDMIGIRFKPAGITAFTRVPVNHMTNMHLDMTNVETLFGTELYESLPGIKSGKERIAHIEKYLLERLSYAYQPDQRIIYTTQMIMESNGQKSIKDIIRSVCLSERQFERKFKSAVGVSAKTFSKIIRFRHASQYIISHPDESLYSAAYACGYYDHSHLIKDFKELGGDSLFSP